MYCTPEAVHCLYICDDCSLKQCFDFLRISHVNAPCNYLANTANQNKKKYVTACYCHHLFLCPSLQPHSRFSRSVCWILNRYYLPVHQMSLSFALPSPLSFHMSFPAHLPTCISFLHQPCSTCTSPFTATSCCQISVVTMVICFPTTWACILHLPACLSTYLCPPASLFKSCWSLNP